MLLLSLQAFSQEKHNKEHEKVWVTSNVHIGNKCQYCNIVEPEHF